jgi:hypothetical protein
VIDEDRIIGHLNMLLESSEPGAELHHLHVLSAPPAGPLGVPDQSQIQATVYAIAAAVDSAAEGEAFMAKTLAAAAIEAAQAGRVVLFAALSQECWSVPPPYDDLAVELSRAGRLQEHPNVAEKTMVYAACRDGRRWSSGRWLTGPMAGRSEDVELLVGAPQRGEGFGPACPLVRRLVGMTR